MLNQTRHVFHSRLIADRILAAGAEDDAAHLPTAGSKPNPAGLHYLDVCAALQTCRNDMGYVAWQSMAWQQLLDLSGPSTQCLARQPPDCSEQDEIGPGISRPAERTIHFKKLTVPETNRLRQHTSHRAQ